MTMNNTHELHGAIGHEIWVQQQLVRAGMSGGPLLGLQKGAMTRGHTLQKGWLYAGRAHTKA